MYRYLTNEAVILMNRIIAESSFFVLRQFLLFSSFVFLCCFCTCGIQRTTLVQVYCWAWWCRYILCMLGRWSALRVACVDQDRYIWKFDFRTVFPTFVLSIRRYMIARIWLYSTPRAVIHSTRMVVQYTKGCYCSQYTWRVEPQWSSTSRALYWTDSSINRAEPVWLYC